MKKLLLFLPLLLGISLLTAQPFKSFNKISSAGGTSIGEAFLIADIVSVKEHGFLVLQSYVLEEKTTLELQLFDLTRTLTNQQTLVIEERRGDAHIQGYTEWNNHFLLLISYYQETTNTNELYLYQYSLPNLALKVESKVMEAYSPPQLLIPFFLAVSPDESQLALASWSYTIPKDPGKLEIRYFNKDLKIAKENKYLFPYPNQHMYLKEGLIDNKGNFYITGKKHSGNLNLSYIQLARKPGNPFVLAFFTDSQKPNLYEIDVKKHHFPLLEFQISPNQELVGLGLYRSGGKRTFAGVSTFTINDTDKSLKLNTAEISKESFNKALGETPPIYKQSPTFRYASIKKVILKDNAYFLIGERIRFTVDQQQPAHNYVYSTAYGMPNTVAQDDLRFDTDFSLLDMFVIKLDTKGTLRWMKRIPKEQDIESDNSQYFSFNVIERERDILLFYNDHPDNMAFKKKDKVKSANLRSATPMLAKVHCSSGKVSKRKLTSLFGKNTLIRPLFCKKIDEEKVFMYGQKKKFDLKAYRMKVANLGGS